MAVITISRGTYTGGQALAERLADKLGYRCLSREELMESARSRFGVPVEKLVAAMDKPPSFWERLTDEKSIYLNYVQAEICEHVSGGDLVFHGYVAHLQLRDISHVLRIRVVEDLNARIRNAMQRHSLDRKEATARTKKIDRERADWMRFLWGIDWEDPSNYDAVLNIARLDIDGAAELVARMAHMEAFNPTAASAKAMWDLTLSSRVWATLAMDPNIMGAGLKAVADAGVVTVTGTVGSWEVADAIPAVAGQVEGVVAVHSDVSVAVPVYESPI